MKPLPSLNLLVTFEAAARRLSFKWAADELCVTQPAVSHQIRILEKHLNISLFHRKNRSIELTVAGKEYYGDISRALSIINKATHKISNSEVTETFRISCIPYLANKLLTPYIHQFQSENLEGVVQIEAKTKRADLLNDNIDVAIRHKKGIEPELHYEKISDVEIAPICSPSYAKRIEAKTAQFHDVITLANDVESWKYWQKNFRLTISPKEILTFDSYEGTINSVKQGAGIAMGYFPILNNELNDESLVELNVNQRIPFGSLYLVYRKTSQKIDLILAFQDWIRAQLEIT